MIIMFRGTAVSKNFAPQILSLYATVNAVKYNRRTLVLQFMRQFPVETILRGQRDNEEDVEDRSRFQFNDAGIDSLFRKIENQKLEKENFELACRSMLKSENLLDVAGVSGKEDFVKEMIKRPKHIAQLLTYATEIYDDIYILGHGKEKELMEVLNPLVDLSVICVPQGNKEEVYAPTSPKDPEKPEVTNDILYMITEFDNRSSFDVSRLKKFYDVKRIAINPYNTGFKDAYNSHNVLSFVAANIEVNEHDSNYFLFNSVFDVHKQIMKNEVPEVKQFDIKKLERIKKEEEEHENKTLDASNVRLTKRYTGFWFWRKEVDGYEVTLDSFGDEGYQKRITGPVAENLEDEEEGDDFEEIEETEAEEYDEEEYEDEETEDDEDEWEDADEWEDEEVEDEEDDEDWEEEEEEDPVFDEDSDEEDNDEDEEIAEEWQDELRENLLKNMDEGYEDEDEDDDEDDDWEEEEEPAPKKKRPVKKAPVKKKPVKKKPVRKAEEDEDDEDEFEEIENGEFEEIEEPVKPVRKKKRPAATKKKPVKEEEEEKKPAKRPKPKPVFKAKKITVEQVNGKAHIKEVSTVDTEDDESTVTPAEEPEEKKPVRKKKRPAEAGSTTGVRKKKPVRKRTE